VIGCDLCGELGQAVQVYAPGRRAPEAARLCTRHLAEAKAEGLLTPPARTATAGTPKVDSPMGAPFLRGPAPRPTATTTTATTRAVQDPDEAERELKAQQARARRPKPPANVPRPRTVAPPITHRDDGRVSPATALSPGAEVAPPPSSEPQPAARSEGGIPHQESAMPPVDRPHDPAPDLAPQDIGEGFCRWPGCGRRWGRKVGEYGGQRGLCGRDYQRSRRIPGLFERLALPGGRPHPPIQPAAPTLPTEPAGAHDILADIRGLLASEGRPQGPDVEDLPAAIAQLKSLAYRPEGTPWRRYAGELEEEGNTLAALAQAAHDALDAAGAPTVGTPADRIRAMGLVLAPIGPRLTVTQVHMTGYVAILQGAPEALRHAGSLLGLEVALVASAGPEPVPAAVPLHLVRPEVRGG